MPPFWISTSAARTASRNSGLSCGTSVLPLNCGYLAYRAPQAAGGGEASAWAACGRATAARVSAPTAAATDSLIVGRLGVHERFFDIDVSLN